MIKLVNQFRLYNPVPKFVNNQFTKIIDKIDNWIEELCIALKRVKLFVVYHFNFFLLFYCVKTNLKINENANVFTSAPLSLFLQKRNQ